MLWWWWMATGGGGVTLGRGIAVSVRAGLQQLGKMNFAVVKRFPRESYKLREGRKFRAAGDFLGSASQRAVERAEWKSVRKWTSHQASLHFSNIVWLPCLLQHACYACFACSTRRSFILLRYAYIRGQSQIFAESKNLFHPQPYASCSNQKP